MIKNYILILFVITGICKPQFTDVYVTLDSRNVNKSHHFLLENLKNDISSYYENTIFSESNADLGIPIKIHIVIESIYKASNVETINAQFFTSNNLDLNQYTKSSTFPYRKGQSITHSSDFDPLSSLLDYFAYIFLANELDMYGALEGTTYFNLAERVSINGKESEYSNGWDDRWKKCKKLIENVHLRNLRFNLYELMYNTELNTEQRNKILLDLDDNIYYLKEFFPNDRNAFLFLDIYADKIGEILKEESMYDALILLSNFDVDNKLIYNKYLK